MSTKFNYSRRALQHWSVDAYGWLCVAALVVAILTELYRWLFS